VALCVYDEKVHDLRQTLALEETVHRQLFDRGCLVLCDSPILWVQHTGILPAEHHMGLHVGRPAFIGHGGMVYGNDVAAVRRSD